jgi:hypothetical protein
MNLQDELKYLKEVNEAFGINTNLIDALEIAVNALNTIVEIETHLNPESKSVLQDDCETAIEQIKTKLGCV